MVQNHLYTCKVYYTKMLQNHSTSPRLMLELYGQDFIFRTCISTLVFTPKTENIHFIKVIFISQSNNWNIHVFLYILFIYLSIYLFILFYFLFFLFTCIYLSIFPFPLFFIYSLVWMRIKTGREYFSFFVEYICYSDITTDWIWFISHPCTLKS